MSLWISEITFTGHLPRRQIPPKITAVINASSFAEACDKTAKFAKRRWPFWRFELEQVGYDRVVK